MCTANNINRDKVDFTSPKLKQAKKIVENDLPLLAEKLSEPLDSLRNAYEKGLMYVGMFTTPCGKSCIFIEHKNRQLLTPFHSIH